MSEERPKAAARGQLVKYTEFRVRCAECKWTSVVPTAHKDEAEYLLTKNGWKQTCRGWVCPFGEHS